VVYALDKIGGVNNRRIGFFLGDDWRSDADQDNGQYNEKDAAGTSEHVHVLLQSRLR
jgi:hypothetical protein